MFTMNNVCSRHKFFAGIHELKKAKKTVKMNEHTASLVDSWMRDTIDYIHLISKDSYLALQILTIKTDVRTDIVKTISRILLNEKSVLVS